EYWGRPIHRGPRPVADSVYRILATAARILPHPSRVSMTRFAHVRTEHAYSVGGTPRRCIPAQHRSNDIDVNDRETSCPPTTSQRPGTDADMGKGIFEGLKVLDCASFIAAPAAATVLSDFGADVIKIEPPGSGDPYRNLPNLPGYPVSEHNFAWLLEARNKRSLALDLSKPEGRAVLHRLAPEAGVFITNYPPAVRERLGITHAHLAPHNERLIYASFTGYGEKGEEANKPGFDSNAYWARSGLMDLVRADTETTPARSIAGMGDHPCAMAFYGAIVTA